MSDEVLQEELEAARRHAGVDHSRFRVWMVSGDPFAPGPPALALQPQWPLNPDVHELFDEAARAQAGDPALLGIHRLAVRTTIDLGGAVALAAVAGLMRHELEHVKQYDGEPGPALYELDCLADRIAETLDEGDDYTHYRSKPVEASANAAAAAFLAERHGDARAQLHGTKFAPFAASPASPTPVDELPRLTVEWIRGRAAGVDDHALFGDDLSWPERIEDAMPGASAWWDG